MPPKPDTIEEFVADPAPAPAVVVERKPNGQNAGDIVDACDAVGGRYEALGAGKMRRLPD